MNINQVIFSTISLTQVEPKSKSIFFTEPEIDLNWIRTGFDNL